MEKRFAVALAASVVLAGCAAPPAMVWRKDGATEEQFRRDQLTCRQYGMQSATANGLNGNLFVESWIQQETSRCLVGLGYSQAPASSVAGQRP